MHDVRVLNYQAFEVVARKIPLHRDAIDLGPDGENEI
jgi:hypothetical protein